jgi:hypothetical protein
MTSMTPSPGRPLTPAVYWRRRLFVIGLLVALVLIVVNGLGGDSEPRAGVQASTVGSDPAASSDAPTTGPVPGTSNKGKKSKGKKSKKNAANEPTTTLPTAPPLAVPDGMCADDDIAATPTVLNAVAGRSATIVINLRTITTAACTWQVSAETLALRISVGDDEVWASRECADQVPERSVVVRQAVTSTYELRWNTRRSETGCPKNTEYAAAGDYRVTVAAYGAEPADLVFDLAAPTAPEPASEPEKPEKKPGKKGKNNNGG